MQKKNSLTGMESQRRRPLHHRLRRTLWILAGLSCVAGIATWREVRADDPPPPEEPSVVVVLDETGVCAEPDADPNDDAVISADPLEFANNVAIYASLDQLTGVGVVSQTPIGPIWPVPAQLQAWATVYDQDTLDMWNDTGFLPAFLEGTEVSEIPSVSEAVFDLDIIAPDADGDFYHMKLRVRSTDGAAAIVFMDPTGGIMQAEELAVRCDGGRWWRWGRICCHVQRLNCTIVRQLLGPILGPAICGNCESCFQQCMDCSVSNPCHSCDPCGLSLILCRWFGHC